MRILLKKVSRLWGLGAKNATQRPIPLKYLEKYLEGKPAQALTAMGRLTIFRQTP
jgi:hypothetical protein